MPRGTASDPAIALPPPRPSLLDGPDPSSTSVGGPPGFTGVGGPAGVGGASSLSAIIEQMDQEPQAGHKSVAREGMEEETQLPPPAPGMLAPGQFIDVPTGVYDQDGPDREEPPTKRAIILRGVEAQASGARAAGATTAERLSRPDAAARGAAAPGSGASARVARPLSVPPRPPHRHDLEDETGDAPRQDEDPTGAFNPSELTTPMSRLPGEGLDSVLSGSHSQSALSALSSVSGLAALGAAADPAPSVSSPHGAIPALPPPPQALAAPALSLPSGENTALTALPSTVARRREDAFTPLTPHERPARAPSGSAPLHTARVAAVSSPPSSRSPLRPALVSPALATPTTPVGALVVPRMPGGPSEARPPSQVLRSSTGALAVQRSGGAEGGRPATGAFSSPLSITAARLSPALPPIPAAPSSSGIVDTLRYLGVVVRGVLSRRSEKLRVRERLVGMQRSLDGLLQQLGRAAFDERLQTPALAEEMRLSAQAEERRLRALQQADQISERVTSETQRDRTAEGEQREASTRLSQEAAHLDSDLQQRAGRRRELLAEVARIDATLRRLARTAEAAAAKARTQAQNPEVASAAAAQATSARGQAEALMPTREQTVAQAEALEGPIAALTQQIGEVRSELSLRQTELQRLAADQSRRQQQSESDLALCRAECQAAERELQQRMMTIGTLVNLTRPAGGRYQALYQQVDELKAGLTDGEAALARLSTESALYDQQAVQRGLLYLGGGALLVSVLLALCYVLLALRGADPPGPRSSAGAGLPAAVAAKPPARGEDDDRDDPAAGAAQRGPQPEQGRGDRDKEGRAARVPAEAPAPAPARPPRYPRARNLASTRFNAADPASR